MTDSLFEKLLPIVWPLIISVLQNTQVRPGRGGPPWRRTVNLQEKKEKGEKGEKKENEEARQNPKAGRKAERKADMEEEE